MGRFLKESGKADKTGAGSLMISLGKTMSQAGQQRISLRSPLLRLFQVLLYFRFNFSTLFQNLHKEYYNIA